MAIVSVWKFIDVEQILVLGKVSWVQRAKTTEKIHIQLNTFQLEDFFPYVGLEFFQSMFFY